ncbi:MAG: hypothetical protein AAGA29_04970 [Planctomycetota bacterium]
MLDSPLLPPRDDPPRAAKARIIIRADRYWHDHPLLQGETPREWWAAYCLDRVSRGMEPPNIATRETIGIEHFTED